MLVPPQGGRKHPEQKLIKVNTQNILFICGGAFEGTVRPNIGGDGGLPLAPEREEIIVVLGVHHYAKRDLFLDLMKGSRFRPLQAP